MCQSYSPEVLDVGMLNRSVPLARTVEKMLVVDQTLVYKTPYVSRRSERT